MKNFLGGLGLALLVLSLGVGFATEKKTDESAPVILRGFKSFEGELSPGGLLLFDGKTLFGWEAKPLVTKRPLGVPDPKISIARGEMRIETSVPMEISTKILFLKGSQVRSRIWNGHNAKGFLRIACGKDEAINPFQNEKSSDEGDLYMESFPAHFAPGLGTFSIVIEEGTIVIRSVAFYPGGFTDGDGNHQDGEGAVRVPLFNGVDITGWKPGGDAKTEVVDGAIHLTGGSGWLESEEEFGDFYFSAEFKENVSPNNSGLFFRTIPGSAMDGYECQMNNNPPDADRKKFLGNDTGSLFRRAAARRVVVDPSDWTSVTVMASGSFFRTWVNGIPTLLWNDDRALDENPRKGCRLAPGTIQFQGHDAGTDVTIRNIAAVSADAGQQKRLADRAAQFVADAEVNHYRKGEGDAFEAFRPRMENLKAAGISLTDFHIHIRGGMTPEHALWRQQTTGIGSGILENAGAEWPISDSEKLRDFIDRAREAVSRSRDGGLLVGIQVNDRDWFTALDPVYRDLDFILADTMIMGTDENGKPQRLWLLPKDYDADPEEWMERYMAHHLQILGEPITILANPTYLPEFLADRYDELWTDQRMDAVIDKAVENNIALEIQAESPFPHDRFIQRALDKGAKLSFGTNNFDAHLNNLDRWNEVFEKFDLKPEQVFQLKK